MISLNRNDLLTIKRLLGPSIPVAKGETAEDYKRRVDQKEALVLKITDILSTEDDIERASCLCSIKYLTTRNAHQHGCSMKSE